MEDTFKYTDNILELLILEEADLPLGVLISISMFEVFPTVGLTKISLSVLEFNVYATSPTYKIVVREKEVMSYVSFFLKKKKSTIYYMDCVGRP